jgi:hypothetical protein
MCLLKKFAYIYFIFNRLTTLIFILFLKIFANTPSEHAAENPLGRRLKTSAHELPSILP